MGVRALANMITTVHDGGPRCAIGKAARGVRKNLLGASGVREWGASEIFRSVANGRFDQSDEAEGTSVAPSSR